jgi:hypothetical protein
MAMESASLLARAIELHGGEREKLSQTYSAAHRGRFRSRLGVSRAVRYAAYEPFLSTAVVRVLSMSKTLRAALARRTRNPHSSFNS